MQPPDLVCTSLYSHHQNANQLDGSASTIEIQISTTVNIGVASHNTSYNLPDTSHMKTIGKVGSECITYAPGYKVDIPDFFIAVLYG